MPKREWRIRKAARNPTREAAIVTSRTALRIVPQVASRDPLTSPDRNLVRADGSPTTPQAKTRFVTLRTRARSPNWTSPRILATAIDSRSPNDFATTTAPNDVIVPVRTNFRAPFAFIRGPHLWWSGRE